MSILSKRWGRRVGGREEGGRERGREGERERKSWAHILKEEAAFHEMQGG